MQRFNTHLSGFKDIFAGYSVNTLQSEIFNYWMIIDGV